MDIKIIIAANFIAGTACIIYGVNLMSKGLEKANAQRIKKCLRTLTRNLPLATVTGVTLTALVQSSTAVTVVTVGLVNSGLLNLTRAVGIIYGANIGTTITAQLMSFKLPYAGYIITAFGLFIVFVSKKSASKNMGWAATGLGLMFVGLNILNSVSPS